MTSKRDFVVRYKVLNYIDQQTGGVRIREVIDALILEKIPEKDIQSAIRILLDRGPLDLDADMRLIRMA